MDTKGFVSAVLPETGWYCIAHLAPHPVTGDKVWHNSMYASLDAAVARALQLCASGSDAYFALAAFIEDKVWDANKPSYKTESGVRVEVKGGYRRRTQSNVRALKSFFLDLDVEPTDPHKFPSKDAALAGLKAFCARVKLPRPMIVDSGGGLHVYWPLVEELPRAEWKAIACKLKAVCVHEAAAGRFKVDRSVPADEARVLRVLGTSNFKRGTPAPVTLLAAAAVPLYGTQMETLLDTYIAAEGVAVEPAPARDFGTPPDNGWGEGNLESDPAQWDRIVFHCRQLQEQVGTRGAQTGERLWRASLGIAKFCDVKDYAATAVSDAHPEYSPAAVADRLFRWNAGPTRCAHFHEEAPALCESCPHWEQIASPIVLGRQTKPAAAPAPEPAVVLPDTIPLVAAPAVEFVEPPFPYRRTADGRVVITTEDADGKPIVETVFPNDLYPVRILRPIDLRADGTLSESTLWRMHLPRVGQVDTEIPQHFLADSRKLHGHFLSHGVYPTQDEIKRTQLYMSQYLKQLSVHADRAQLYEHLGWQTERKTFVIGMQALTLAGLSTCDVAPSVKAVMKEHGLAPGGTLEAWKAAMLFYSGPQYAGHRFFLYASLGAPLFHMAGHKGALLTASGETGRGKSTCLEACASFWGPPDAMILNGNKDGSTVNALYDHIGTYHSLPFLWDDITERDPEEIRRFLLNISQGKGKERLRGTEHAKQVAWETLVLSSANNDDVSRILAGHTDADPHLMRLVPVEFADLDITTEAKIKADRFKREIAANYGHAGPIFMNAVMQAYDRVKNRVLSNVEKIDRAVEAESQERYWTAVVACAYTAAELASKLGLIAFPIEQDLQWMLGHLSAMRSSMASMKNSPAETLATMLSQWVPNTLVLSASHTSNLSNVALAPHGVLIVRHEFDTGLIYIARSAVSKYCIEHGVNIRVLERSLRDSGTLLDGNTKRTLGAGTSLAHGQEPCWKVNALQVSGGFAEAISDAIAQDSNVVAMPVRRTV